MESDQAMLNPSKCICRGDPPVPSTTRRCPASTSSISWPCCWSTVRCLSNPSTLRRGCKSLRSHRQCSRRAPRKSDSARDRKPSDRSRCRGPAPSVAVTGQDGQGRMTLLLSNEDVETALGMPDCLEAMEIAYRDLGLMQGGNGLRSEVLTPTSREDALYSLLTMSGVIPRFGIGAVRINSDIALCATNSLQPVLSAEWLEPGMHVSSLSRLELDPSVVAAANVVFSHVREADGRIVRTAGADLARDAEQRKAALSSAIGQSTRPELSDLLLGKVPGRGKDSDITLFFNYSGLGYQFAATGHVIYKKARELGLGRELDTSLFTSAAPS